MTTHIGERFVQAIAAQDSAALLSLLAPDVDFRAMTPSRFWEATSASEVVDDILLGQWFGPSERIDSVQSVECGTVADRDRVGYQLRVTNADGAFTVEQQAYFGVDHDRISWLRIMCSGYRAAQLSDS